VNLGGSVGGGNMLLESDVAARIKEIVLKNPGFNLTSDL